MCIGGGVVGDSGWLVAVVSWWKRWQWWQWHGELVAEVINCALFLLLRPAEIGPKDEVCKTTANTDFCCRPLSINPAILLTGQTDC